MTRIGIIGGHGKIALLAAPLFVQEGFEVTSIIRNPDQASDVEATGATALVQDVMELSTEEMAQVFRDAALDVVVWSAGAGGGDPERTWKVDRDAAIRSMDAAAAAGIRRYVMVSYLGASLQHTVTEDNSFYAYAQAKAEADEHLRGTGLDWTLVGPTALSSDAPTGRIRITTERTEGVTASRANVAQVLVDVVRDQSTIGKALPFTDGETPIREAIAAAPESKDLA